MAQSYLQLLSVRGVTGRFNKVFDKIPTIYQNHCALYDADTEIMPHAIAGFVPRPREFTNGRMVQGIRDFSFNVTNKEYELTIEIPRKWMEDDQTGAINQRIDEIAETWQTFYDYQFAQLLINGATSTYNGWDGATFYNDSRTIGGSATIDNKLTSAAATSTTPTTAEMQTAVRDIKKQLWKFQNDQGNPFNAAVMGMPKPIRFVLPADYEFPFKGAVQSALTGGGDTNVYVNVAEGDVSPYLAPTAEATKMYANVVGGSRKPFIFQKRTDLEIKIDNREEEVAKTGVIAIYCRQRYVFAYGEPRMSIEYTWS